MAASGETGLDFLTRRHGVKIVSVASVEACCLGVGEVVGHQNILSASRMNNATVIFLNSVERANEVVARGIIIDETLTPVLPLLLPSKKITISNIPPFLSDDILKQALSRYGKLISPIKKITIGCESPLLKHIVSFRRFAFMIVKDDAELDLALNFRVDDFEYVVFVTTDRMKCFGCGKSGHLIRSCPDKSSATGSSKDSAAAEKNNSVKPSEVVSAEAVLTVEKPAGQGTSGVGPVEAGSTSAESVNEGRDTSESLLAEEITLLSSDVENVREDDVSEMEAENKMFKVPTKRKNVESISSAKCYKKREAFEDQKESESESEMSDSSTVMSQTEGEASDISRSYEVDDIKRFLNTTKNKRGVIVKEYFPDLKQFHDKAKSLMAEGCLSNKEVYRLKNCKESWHRFK